MEYYFPEEKKEVGKNLTHSQTLKNQTFQNKRSSAGGTTKTTVDSLSEESGGNEFSKIKRKMKKLEINSVDDSRSGKLRLESPQSQRTLKKRRFR